MSSQFFRKYVHSLITLMGIRCMLHNFGGNIEMYGILDAISSGPIDAHNSKNSTMVCQLSYMSYSTILSIKWFFKYFLVVSLNCRTFYCYPTFLSIVAYLEEHFICVYFYTGLSINKSFITCQKNLLSDYLNGVIWCQ